MEKMESGDISVTEEIELRVPLHGDSKGVGRRREKERGH